MPTSMSSGNLYAFSDQLGLFLFIDRLRIAEFLDRSDHREHDAQLAIYRSADQCTQLRTEDIRAVQAQTDGAIAQERVHLFREREILQLLVAADVQRTNDDLLAAHAFQHGLICFKLLFLCREVIRIHVQELGAEQTDAFAAVLQDALDILDAARCFRPARPDVRRS